MKKLILSIVAVVLTAVCAMALPKAIYVKKGNTYTKYNFGVAGDLKFSDGGKKLSITGYSEVIDLDNIDYITFTAPVDELSLTPSQQKNKMVQIGEKAYDMIDANDNAELLRMHHTFFDEIKVRDTEWKRPISEYDVPEEYWNVHKKIDEALGAVNLLVNGNPAAGRQLKAAAVDLYKASDYFGIYFPDYDNEKWTKIADADYLEVRFRAADGDNYAVKLVASEAYTTWNTKDFNGQMPEKMTITYSKGRDKLAEAVIDTKLVQDKSIEMTLHADANGYVVDNTMTVVNNAIDDVATVTIKGKYFCKAVSHIDGKNLVNYDEMYPAVKEAMHYHDEYDNCCGENPEELFAHIFRGNADVDVLGELQIKAKVFGLDKLYDQLSKDDYYDELVLSDGSRLWTSGKVIKHEGDAIYRTYDNTELMAEHAKYLNNYTDVSFYYDGEKQLQGFLGWEVDEDYYEYDYPEIFAIIEGRLVYTERDHDWIYNATTGEYEEVFGQPYYYVGIYDEDGNWKDNKKVYVPEGQAVHVERVRTYDYDVMPMLIFPDLTSFAFEDFFDEDSFKKLIDDYDAIIDTYYEITGQEREEDEYDYPVYN